MSNRLPPLVSMYSAFCCVLVSWGQVASPTNELTRLQSTYLSAASGIDAKYLALQTNAQAQYLQKLDLLEKAYQQKGDFKSIVAVREERKEPVAHLPGPDTETDPQELKTLKERMRALPSQREQQRKMELATLVTAYLTRLTSLQREVTKQGQMDLATEVQSEIDKAATLLPTQAQQAQPATIATTNIDKRLTHNSGREGPGEAPVAQSDPDIPGARGNQSKVFQPGGGPTKTSLYLCELNEVSASVGASDLTKGRLDTWVVNSKVPRKGIFAHAPSDLVYDIGALQMTVLEGTVGIGRVNHNSKVQFRIHGDDKLLWQSRELAQGTKAGESMTDKFSVDITGISRLRLEVDPLGSIDSDHSLWIDPRLIRKR